MQTFVNSCGTAQACSHFFSSFVFFCGCAGSLQQSLSSFATTDGSLRIPGSDMGMLFLLKRTHTFCILCMCFIKLLKSCNRKHQFSKTSLFCKSHMHHVLCAQQNGFHCDTKRMETSVFLLKQPQRQHECTVCMWGQYELNSSVTTFVQFNKAASNLIKWAHRKESVHDFF